MELKDYTTEELMAELKKRNAEKRAKKESYYQPRQGSYEKRNANL